MANLVLTTSCNRRCAWCFAGLESPGREMSIGDARALMDFVSASGSSEVSLLGGEPTLAPEFSEILQMALARGFDVLIFSNGVMPASALDAILRAPAQRCRIMLNLNIGEQIPSEQEHAAASLGERAFVGVNIHRPGLPLAEAAEFVKTFGLRRVIRLGLAQPRLDRRNSWLYPRDYQRIGGEIEEFLERFGPEGFSVDLDCGFVPCMFTAHGMELLQMSAGEIGNRCGAIPDLMPDMTSVHCFPLAELDQLPVEGTATFPQLRKLHEQRAAPYRQVGVFRECASCAFRRAGDCSGGCIAAAMLRVNRRPLETKSPDEAACGAVAQPVRAWSIPYIDQPLEFWESIAGEFGDAIREVYFPIPIEGVGSGRPLLPDKHLPALLQARILPMAVLVNPVVLPRRLDEIAAPIIEELARLHFGYGAKSATLTDVRLAKLVREKIPGLSLAGSCLLEAAEAAQARQMRDVFDVLVPATRTVRMPARLSEIRQAFGKPLRIMVNEGCLPMCLDRRQHFFEMAHVGGVPASLCAPRLEAKPWLRLTGAWILPQHLSKLDPVADEYKLAGRAALADPEQYARVLRAYVRRTALWPDDIGGGPASALSQIPVSRALFNRLLDCGQICDDCDVCRRACPTPSQDTLA